MNDYFDAEELSKEIFNNVLNNYWYSDDFKKNKTKFKKDDIIDIGGFKIKAKDLGELLRKFAEENMPQVLV